MCATYASLIEVMGACVLYTGDKNIPWKDLLLETTHVFNVTNFMPKPSDFAAVDEAALIIQGAEWIVQCVLQCYMKNIRFQIRLFKRQHQCGI